MFGHHLYTLDADEVAVVLLVLGLCHGEDDWCGCAVGGGNGVGVGVVALDQLGDVVVGGTLADDRTVEHLSCREFQAGVVEVDGSAGVAHVDIGCSCVEHLCVGEGEVGLGAILKGLEGSDVGHGLHVEVFLDEGLLHHGAHIAFQVFLHGFHRRCLGDGERTTINGGIGDGIGTVGRVIDGEVGVRRGDGHLGRSDEWRGAGDGQSGRLRCPIDHGFHFLNTPVAGASRTCESDRSSRTRPNTGVRVVGTSINHIGCLRFVGAGEGYGDLRQTTALGSHGHGTAAVKANAISRIVIFTVIGSTGEGDGEIASVERVGVLDAVFEA